MNQTLLDARCTAQLRFARACEIRDQARDIWREHQSDKAKEALILAREVIRNCRAVLQEFEV